MSESVVASSSTVMRPFGPMASGVSPAGTHCAKRRRDHQTRARIISVILRNILRFRLPILLWRANRKVTRPEESPLESVAEGGRSEDRSLQAFSTIFEELQGNYCPKELGVYLS